MQFLFGMMMIELIVQGTLWLAKIHWWFAKFAWQLTWSVTRSLWWQVRAAVAAAIEQRRGNK